MTVELSEEAREQAQEIDAWWRENRRHSPELFTRELEHSLTLLIHTPTLGVRYEARGKSVRRLLLRRTHYYLYFVEEAERLYVVAIWSAYRGHGPRL